MRRKQMTALALSALLTLSLTACGSSDSEDTTTTEDTTATGVAVQVETVQAADIATENNVSGTISADNESSIYIGATAKCTAVYAKAGDTVQAGEKICTLDLGSSLSSYNAARISYNSAVQSYQDQKSLLDKQVSMAEDNWTNTQALFEIGAASQLEVDQAELSYENAVVTRTSTLSQLEASIQNAKSGVEQLDLALEDVDSNGNVVAPISGVLVTMNAVENSYISNSLPLAVIDGPDQMKLVASVSEALVPRLSIGDEAAVSVSAIETEFTATIRNVEQSANAQTKLYTVTLTIPEDVTGLLAGMFADVTFHTEVSEGAVVIPSEAILTSGSTQYVYTVENDTAKYVEVTTGLTGSGVTEILTGLEPGAQLVTVGQAYLSDGDAVRIVTGED